MRHSAKSLMKPALRPHFQQRRITRVEYFGFTKLLFAFAIRDFFAMMVNYFADSTSLIKGKFIAVNRALAGSSLPALVTIET